jgi:hypothetical protein
MKKKISLVFSLVAITSLVIYVAVSCKKKEDITPQLSISVTTISIAAAANSTDTFSIASNTSWTAASSQSWLTVDPVSGSKDGKVTLTVQQNADTMSRTATVTVSAKGTTSQTLTVTQTSIYKKSLTLAATTNSADTFNII